jgi:hypothetical protein
MEYLWGLVFCAISMHCPCWSFPVRFSLLSWPHAQACGLWLWHIFPSRQHISLICFDSYIYTIYILREETKGNRYGLLFRGFWKAPCLDPLIKACCEVRSPPLSEASNLRGRAISLAASPRGYHWWTLSYTDIRREQGTKHMALVDRRCMPISLS